MRNSTIAHTLTTSLLLLAVTTPMTHTRAQCLPPSHKRSADILPSGDHAVRKLLMRTSTRFVRYTVGFSNIDQDRVIFNWEGAFFTDGVMDYDLRKLKWQTETTPFHPLAIAAEGGIGDTIYVVGWSDRTGELVIEEWSMGTAALSQIATPGGDVVVDLVPPSLTKREIFRGSGVGPAYDAVFHPTTRQLLLLADDAPIAPTAKSFYSIDVDDPQSGPSVRSDMNIALLPDALGLKLAVTDAGAVYVFVFVVPHWGEYPVAPGKPIPPSIQTHVFCDQDGNGVFEISYQDSAEVIMSLEDTVMWNRNYVAAPGP